MKDFGKDRFDDKSGLSDQKPCKNEVILRTFLVTKLEKILQTLFCEEFWKIFEFL